MYGEARRRRPSKCFLVTIDMKVRDHLDISVWVRKGSFCLEQQDNGTNQGEYQWVKVLDNRGIIIKVENRFLMEVPSNLAGLLEPVDPEQRLRLIENPGLLTHLATLPEGTPLWVTMGQDDLAEAELRYIGPVSSSSSAIYFGVQLKGSAKGRGLSDGSYNGRQFFHCPEHCATFVPGETPFEPTQQPHQQPPSNHPSNHPSNGNGNHSNHHSNGHQEKASRRISLHQSQHTAAKPSSPQSILPRTTDPAPAPVQTPAFRWSTPSSSLQVGQKVHVSINDTPRLEKCAGAARSLEDPLEGFMWACSWKNHANQTGVRCFRAKTKPPGCIDPSSEVNAKVCASPKCPQTINQPHIIIISSVPAHCSCPQNCPDSPNRTKPPPLPPPKPPHKPLPYVPNLKPNSDSINVTEPQQILHSPLMPRRSQEEPEEAGDVFEEDSQEKEQSGLEKGRRRGLELGSMVEVNDPPLYGVIRWIGRIDGVQDTVAGVELEQEVSVGTDGTAQCRRDSRFPEPETPVNQVERCNSIAFAEWGSERVEDHTPPVEGQEARQRYQGWKRGIQGHLNSCYLDASLFSLFSCCSSADWVLFWPIDAEKHQSSSQAQDLLRCEIVNPLRKFGYVCASKTMALRRLLEAANNDAGFTNQEKDPEEFLNKLFQLLTVEPLLKIRSMSQQAQQCHIYQLFPPSLPPSPSSLPQDDTPHSPIALLAPPPGRMRVSSVQALLESSFYHSRLKFVEAPSCLLLLMPRFGKDFKMYDAILPSLSIDITDLVDDSLRQCSICESAAQWECPQCYDDPDITPGHLKQYCATCNTQVHSHKKRSSHSPLSIAVPQELTGASLRCTRQRMTLFAVTCIETSHYVSFVRHGPDAQDWLFFDSMADREGGENGFNVPLVKGCPEVGRYLSLSEEELGRVDAASLKEPVRRILLSSRCDLKVKFVAMASPGGQGALSTRERGSGGPKRMKWALELSMGNTRSRSERQGGQGDVVYPIGYSEKPVPDTSIQETDKNLVEKRCWDVALGPLKQIPMNLFIMYMSGNTISIFPIMMVCMMAWRPIQALMSMSATFKLLESSSQQWLQGLVYLVGNLLASALAIYKCQSMGLLPTHSSDWLAFIEPPQRLEIMGGGMVFDSVVVVVLVVVVAVVVVVVAVVVLIVVVVAVLVVVVVVAIVVVVAVVVVVVVTEGHQKVGGLGQSYTRNSLIT
ncbi:hypothetical protein WMY93_015153 [Mugilogobius chulae]|uniref:ER membrane protein complex subunit 4 n=1 Tax=Mugilogobius chulae TaxID=88201 RepID=A0AAW0NXJ1_9GOBI